MSTQSLVTLEFEQFVKAPPAQVFRAFTNATSLREWMCDIATVSPQPGGRLYLAWNAGFYACGEYTQLEAEHKAGQEVPIAFTWYGRNEPAQTEVEVLLSAKDGGTQVKLTHRGLGEDQAWDTARQEIKEGWQSSLENLASVLESGEDLRFTNRPMLGVLLNDFTPEHAKELGVPVTQGVRIDDVVPGLGAQAAGLQSNDVLVGMAGHPIKDFPDFPVALRGKRAGDRVEVDFYRGSQKMSVLMELSRRPLPAIPTSTKGLASVLRQRYLDLLTEIDEFFANVSEAQAGYKPSPSDWSAKEVLAHLIHGERFQQFGVAELATGFERQADGFGGNLNASVRATVAAYPTLAELLEALKRSYTETVALFEELPEDFAENKGSFWRLAIGAMEAPYHFNSHLEQMRQSIQAAGQA
ncbi:MAG: SRPBCC domain-containing protein [Chloroflexota bacterium]